MAADAIALFIRMRDGKLFRVAGKALRPEKGDWLHRLIVRVMAGSTPHLTVTLSGASTSGELLHMADDFELLGAGTLRDVNVSSEDILRLCPARKSPNLFPGLSTLPTPNK